ncbi:hypothetical protein NIES2104_51850 [Leptolyngbya sp. NIES-2104]|nr:hypothetical protein NIES2104_51850 [Leptolyngbya sp. NIES-2104]
MRVVVVDLARSMEISRFILVGLCLLNPPFWGTLNETELSGLKE